jgi:alpha-1,3/alpha-1,6-mannosyltransferase
VFLLTFSQKRFFLSLNRFEKKKNLELAVEAFALLDEKLRRSLHLVLAGGFDDRVEENARVYGELERLVSRLGLKESVSLVKNLNQESKLQMLQFCIALVYTPPNEHFGIVPLEAMVLGRPVVASNSGGPTETVADEQTGFLCEDNAASFARAMRLLAENEERAASMGKRAAERVRELFGPAAFKRQLANLVE